MEHRIQQLPSPQGRTSSFYVDPHVVRLQADQQQLSRLRAWIYRRLTGGLLMIVSFAGGWMLHSCM